MDEFDKALDKQTDNFAQDMAKAAYRDGARWAREWCDKEWDAMKQDRDMFQAENVKLRGALEKIKSYKSSEYTQRSFIDDMRAIRELCEQALKVLG